MRVGIDVGGTTVKIGFVEGNEIKYDYSIKTKAKTLFDDVFSNVVEFAKEKGIKIEFVGIGVPGHVKNDVITRLPNVGIENFDIIACARKYFGPEIPVKSSNDANVAALGEAVYSKVDGSCFMVTLGTGVGGGYVNNYKIVEGAHANVGEIGHMFIDAIHRYKCSCGLEGCLETISSATGITRLALEYRHDFPQSTIDFNNLSAKEVADKAKQHDRLAEKVIYEASSNLGRAIASIALCVDPDVFFIGGGVAASGDYFVNIIRENYKKHAHYAVKDIPIEIAKLGNKAGILGASYLGGIK